MTQWIARSGGRELVSQQWLDFENHRARSDNYGDATSILDGPTTTAIDPAAATILYSAVVDDIQEMTYDAHSTELRSNPVTAEGAFGGSEFASGASDVVLLGRQALGGVQVDVYRVDLNIPRGQERSADFGLIYADSATGLRLREEWLLGSPGRAWVYHMYEYRLLPRTPEIEARMEPEALIELAAQALAGHMAEIAELDFPVWGLPAGALRCDDRDRRQGDLGAPGIRTERVHRAGGGFGGDKRLAVAGRLLVLTADQPRAGHRQLRWNRPHRLPHAGWRRPRR
jgi:hypothetical protein